MNTRDQILLINLLIDHLRMEKKELKDEMVIKCFEFMEILNKDDCDNIAWSICNDLGDVISLRGEIARLCEIRQELL